MAVYKDRWNGYNGNTWRVAVYYTDWQGNRRKHEKRGFTTKRDATAYEREFVAKTSRDINMGFGTFLDIYLSDLKPQLKVSTMENKENIIESHIRPYFGKKSLSGITSTDVLQWQNDLLSKRDDDGKGYSPTYLRSIHNQLKNIDNTIPAPSDLQGRSPSPSHLPRGIQGRNHADFHIKIPLCRSVLPGRTPFFSGVRTSFFPFLFMCMLSPLAVRFADVHPNILPERCKGRSLILQRCARPITT